MSDPGAGEWMRVIDIRHLPPAAHRIVADEAERRRLAGRFGLTSIDRLSADVEFIADAGRVAVTGRITAEIVQACAISGEDFPVSIDEPVNLRFVPLRDVAAPEEEIELSAEACDEIDYTGLTFDVGEALAQTLALSIDPFAQGPDADRVRVEHGLAGASGGGAFAALAALKPKD